MTQRRVRVKFCGMTREQDIAQAIGLGVDAIGLIFYPKSSRFLSLARARELLREIPPFVNAVAVLVNPLASFVEELIAELPVDYLQFHGEESLQFCEQFKKPYIKAVQASSTSIIEKFSKEHPQAAALLLDTPSTSCHGGTEKTFDWGLIPQHLSKPLILAGGLNADNVAAALSQCKPYAVDVCSGVEASPGIKDHKKMSRFVNAVWGKE